MKTQGFFTKVAVVLAALGALSTGALSAATGANSWALKNGEVIDGEFLRIRREEGIFRTPAGETKVVALGALGPDASQRARQLWGEHLSDAVVRIDEAIDATLSEQGLEPNADLSDEQFVRRIYLAVAGTIPTYDETVRFLRDRDPKKRFNLVSRLLETEAHVSHFYNYYADLFRIQDVVPGTNLRTDEFSQWIKQSVRKNKPYDEFVYEMLTANGRIWDDPASGFLLRDYDTRLDHIQYTAKVLLGTDIACAQCHDDPFQEWTMMDYYRLTAFLSETNTESRVNRSLTKADPYYFQGPVLQRMSAEQTWDSLMTLMVENPLRFRKAGGGGFDATASLINKEGQMSAEEFFEVAEGYIAYENRMRSFVDTEHVSDFRNAEPAIVEMMGGDRKGVKVEGLTYGNLIWALLNNPEFFFIK